MGSFSLDDLARLPFLMKVAVWLGIIALVVVVGGFVLVKPKYDEVTSAKEQEPQLKQTLLQRQQTKADYEAYQVYKEKLEKIFDTSKSILPQEVDAQGLIREVSKIADNYGFALSVVRGSAKSYGFYQEQQYNVTTSCITFRQIGDFVAELAKLNRIIEFRDMTFHALADTSCVGRISKDERALQLNGQLIVYLTGKDK